MDTPRIACTGNFRKFLSSDELPELRSGSEHRAGWCSVECMKTAEQAGYMELPGAVKDAGCQIVAVPGGVSSKLGCCNLFQLRTGAQEKFSCGTCKFVKKTKPNPLFSFHPAMVPRRTHVSARRQARKATQRSTPSMGMRMSHAERLREDKLLREIAKLGRREKNAVTKKKKKKSTRPRKRTSARRKTAKRNPKRRTLSLGLTLNTKQKRRLASFLHRATGRRVKVQ